MTILKSLGQFTYLVEFFLSFNALSPKKEEKDFFFQENNAREGRKIKNKKKTFESDIKTNLCLAVVFSRAKIKFKKKSKNKKEFCVYTYRIFLSWAT